MKAELLQRWQAVQAWYATQTPGDQRMLRLLTLVLSLTLPVFAIVLPLSHWAGNQRAAYTDANDLLQWVHRMAPTVAAATGKVAFAGDLMALNAQLGARFQLKPKRTDMLDDSRLRVSFDNVAFDQLALWLQAAEEAGAVLGSVEVIRGNNPGLVDANILLTQ